MLSELWLKWTRNWWFWVGILALFSLAILLAFWHGHQNQIFEKDFIHYYTTALNFTKGEPLYFSTDKGLEFLFYPPFAACLFQFLTYIPPETGATILSLLNLLVYPLIIFFLLRLMPDDLFQRKMILLLFPLLFSLRYFFANFNNYQINAFTLLLVLWGLHAYQKEKYRVSSVLFSLAACIKIIPAIFMLWLFFRVPRFRIVIASFATVLLLFALPFPFRGFQQSLTDLHDFFIQVLHPYLLRQEVFTHYHNQSLSAAIGRLLMLSTDESTFTYNLINLPYSQATKIIAIAKGLLAFSFIASMIYRIRKKITFGLDEIALVFLFSHLFSALTWKNHLVTMIVVLIPLFMIRFREQSKITKALLVFLYFLLTILSLNISYLVPDEVRFLIGGFSLYTLMMMILYVVFTVRCFRERGPELNEH